MKSIVHLPLQQCFTPNEGLPQDHLGYFPESEYMIDCHDDLEEDMLESQLIVVSQQHFDQPMKVRYNNNSTSMSVAWRDDKIEK